MYTHVYAWLCVALCELTVNFLEVYPPSVHNKPPQLVLHWTNSQPASVNLLRAHWPSASTKHSNELSLRGYLPEKGQSCVTVDVWLLHQPPCWRYRYVPAHTHTRVHAMSMSDEVSCSCRSCSQQNSCLVWCTVPGYISITKLRVCLLPLYVWWISHPVPHIKNCTSTNQ